MAEWASRIRSLTESSKIMPRYNMSHMQRFFMQVHKVEINDGTQREWWFWTGKPHQRLKWDPKRGPSPYVYRRYSANFKADCVAYPVRRWLFAQLTAYRYEFGWLHDAAKIRVIGKPKDITMHFYDEVAERYPWLLTDGDMVDDHGNGWRDPERIELSPWNLTMKDYSPQRNTLDPGYIDPRLKLLKFVPRKPEIHMPELETWEERCAMIQAYMDCCTDAMVQGMIDDGTLVERYALHTWYPRTLG